MALNNACRHFPREQKVIEPETLKIFHEAECASCVCVFRAHPPICLPFSVEKRYIALSAVSAAH
jgi:hypothetical protein